MCTSQGQLPTNHFKSTPREWDIIPQEVTTKDQKYSVLCLLKVVRALRFTKADMYMAIVSIAIKIDVVFVSWGSGPRKMSLGASILNACIEIFDLGRTLRFIQRGWCFKNLDAKWAQVVVFHGYSVRKGMCLA